MEHLSALIRDIFKYYEMPWGALGQRLNAVWGHHKINDLADVHPHADPKREAEREAEIDL
jgi:hypothetical protein